MAYCKSCGAYIPDGQSACLACGYDETAQAKKAGKRPDNGDGRAYAFDSDELKAQLEKQRRELKEKSKKWAEEEYARRQAAKEKQAESSAGGDRAESTSETARDFGGAASNIINDVVGTVLNNKVLAALSYLSILCFLPYIFCPNDRFARFHARQGLKLLVAGVIADIVGALFAPVGVIFSIFRIYCIYKGMTNASAGREEPLPYIGRFGS